MASSAIAIDPNAEPAESVELQLFDEGNVLQQENDPFDNEDDEGDEAAEAAAARERATHLVNDPFEQLHRGLDQPRVIAPTAADDDEADDSCGVCMDDPPAGERAQLLCCRHKLCLGCAQRIGACPFCRSEPLIWGLQ